MLYDCKRISYWIDWRLTDLAGPDYDAPISFGLPFESEDCQYGKSRLNRGQTTTLLPSATKPICAGWRSSCTTVRARCTFAKPEVYEYL